MRRLCGKQIYRFRAKPVFCQVGRKVRRLIFPVLVTLIAVSLLMSSRAVDGVHAAESQNGHFTLDFSGYKGGSVEQWLSTKGYAFEKDAKKRNLLGLSISDGSLVLSANGPLSGFILNDSINLEKATTVRINWGIIRYPEDVAYSRQVNNEALMVYFFFGNEKIASGHMLIPNSPYFIGLFLGRDERINFPYKGRYFHIGGRFVCLGNPKPNETIISEFDLDSAFKSYFGKSKTPGISATAFGVHTSKAAGGGKAAASIKSIEFIEHGRG